MKYADMPIPSELDLEDCEKIIHWNERGNEATRDELGEMSDEKYLAVCRETVAEYYDECEDVADWYDVLRRSKVWCDPNEDLEFLGLKPLND